MSYSPQPPRPVVTRFAPSPTGYLHIGGARTALFNYLYAKANGGQYRLRIEDTDLERSTDSAKQAILDGLGWMGLPHDGEIVYQSSRANRHREVADILLAKGAAYRCYCSAEELELMREQARSNGSSVSYDRRWRDRPASDAPRDVLPTIRIKAPIDRPMIIDDAVQGTITIPQGALDDFIILRSDGNPTYMLAVVVDDHDMGVTHIIRGDDHLNNAARQACIYEAMGWDIPQFAHIPLIHGPDGAKLSKRHGALGVDAYRDMGYLPEALRNYLLRLGWSHGDDEIISDAQAAEWFDLTQINRAASRFDYDKLTDLNGHYIRMAANERLAELAQPFIEGFIERSLNSDDQQLLLRAMPSLKERAKTIVQLAESACFYFINTPQPDSEKAFAQLEAGLSLLRDFLPILEAHDSWDHESLFTLAKAFATDKGIKIGLLMEPVRVAITGSTGAPSMFEVMSLLGKPATIARITSALNHH